jgi:hypothetical protein
MERRGRITGWTQLCEMVMKKYDKDPYQVLLRQLDSLRQTGSVLEYQETFEKIAHAVVLYNSAYNETFFITRFVGGLKEEIRVPLMLHQPPDVDTASALALIQEQELDSSCAATSGRIFTRGALKNIATADKNKQQDTVKVVPKVTRSESDDKIAALRTFRHRNGLYFKCGEKWNPNHTCPAHVSLHALEEILDAMDITNSVEEDDIEVDVTTESQKVLAVEAISPVQVKPRQTMKLLAQIGKHQVLVLVDSGSMLF